jgi:hypothetical protein
MAAFLIGQPDPSFKPRHQQVRTARGHPSGPGLNQLAQGGIKPEPQLDHLQDTPKAFERAKRYVAVQDLTPVWAGQLGGVRSCVATFECVESETVCNGHFRRHGPRA